MNVFVPSAALLGLSVPPVAVTDGSTAPEWVEVPIKNRWTHRPDRLRLPFDPATAERARRLMRWHRLHRLAIRPTVITLVVIDVLWWLLDLGDRWPWPVVQVTALFVGAVAALRSWHTRGPRVRQLPERIGPHGVYLQGLAAPAAFLWLAHNPEVRPVPGRPRWRLFSRRVYLGLAFTCATAAGALGVLTAADTTPWRLSATAALVIAALVAAAKCLPLSSAYEETEPEA